MKKIFRMNDGDKYSHIIAKRMTTKINEKDIKIVVPIIIPVSKEFIGYLTYDE